MSQFTHKEVETASYEEIDDWFSPIPGEQPIFITHPSWVIEKIKIGSVLAVATFLLLASGYLYFFTTLPEVISTGVFAFSGLVAFAAGFRYLGYKNHYYVITNKRVVTKTNIIGKSTVEKAYKDINGVETDISPLEWFINKVTSEQIGDIVLRTPDDRGRVTVLENFPQSQEVEYTLSSHIDKISMAAGGANSTDPRYSQNQNQVSSDGQAHNMSQHQRHDHDPTTTTPTQPNDGHGDDVYSPSDNLK